MRLPRTSGVQLHVTSLPDGKLGASALAFVDWLAAAGQSWWQVLPLGPPNRHRSPYKAASAFAAWRGLLADPDAAVSPAELDAFRSRHAFWADDWAAYAGGVRALRDQVRFEREWSALRSYAADRGLRLIGDIPIYVAPRGADHRAHPHLFQKGWVAGTPPDAYSDSGQRWGNPLYDWPALRGEGYRWWVERMRRTSELFDIARIDHFRGFVAYWAVPAKARTAMHGHWKRGPGRPVFDAIAAQLGDLPLIAEDLGVITPPVERLRDELGLPGMLVLQFGFDPDDPRGPHRLENHVENRIVYTGTHDADTVRGWYEALPAERRAEVDAAIDEHGVHDDEPWWSLIRLTFASPARVAMVQAQDVLGLGSDARMNVPGQIGSAWRWKLKKPLPTDLAKRLRQATEEAERA
jgi:4-alpha-glucanotransferase